VSSDDRWGPPQALALHDLGRLRAHIDTEARTLSLAAASLWRFPVVVRHGRLILNGLLYRLGRPGMGGVSYEQASVRLHADRGAFARERVLPHMQALLEVVGEHQLAVAVRSPEEVAAHQPRLGQWVDEAVGRQRLLARHTVALLVSDPYTWDELIRPDEDHDARLCKLVAHRRRVGNLHGLALEHARVPAAAAATVQILRHLAARSSSPVPMRGEPAGEWLAEIAQRLALVDEVEDKAQQAVRMGRELADLLGERRGAATTAQRRAETAARQAAARRERDERAEARRRVIAEERELAAEVERLANAYTVSSREIRSFGWRVLGHRLTAGTATDEWSCPGYSKTEVRRLLGLLKLVRERQGDLPDAVERLLEAEAALRAKVAELSAEREWLADEEQLLAHGQALHLGETLEWAGEHWEDVSAVLQDVVPQEWALLRRALRRRRAREARGDAASGGR
jgi:hypothetical protein